MEKIVRDVRKIYGAHEKLKREDVQILQEWIKKQPHLPQLTEFQVIAFLHSCYYSVEATKTTIDNFFTKTTHFSHIFEHLSKDDLKITSSVLLITVLPKTTPEGYHIILLKFVDLRPENFNVTKGIKLLYMVFLVLLFELGPSKGLVALFDVKGVSLSHLLKVNWVIVKHSIDFLQEGVPVKIKQIHVVNMVPTVDKILAMVKPFTKSELLSLIQLHPSFDTLYTCVPKQCLPEDYGGELASSQIFEEQNLKHLLKNYELFIWHDSLKVDESKRVEKSNLFGIEGTFKKLEVD